MILGEYLECFFISTPRDEPTRRFGKEKDEEDLDKGRRCLQ
jgi:hypothetical protein